MFKNVLITGMMCLLLMISGCSDADSGEPVTSVFSFDGNVQNWEGGFADLPINYENQGYDVDFGYTLSPVEGEEGGCILLKGNNHSDDLFMYAVTILGSNDGLKKNTEYSVDLTFTLVTNIPSEMMGIGGSPGESVYIKAGVVNKEPKSIQVTTSGTTYYRMNIDIGNQSTGGQDMVVLGNAAKGEGPGQSDESYQYKYFNHEFRVTTDDKGDIWVIIGADSGFEGVHEIYFDNVSLTFTLIRESE